MSWCRIGCDYHYGRMNYQLLIRKGTRDLRVLSIDYGCCWWSNMYVVMHFHGFTQVSDLVR